MNKLLSKNPLFWAVLLLCIGLLIALMVIGAYLAVFAPMSSYSLAKTDVAWSNFGSYVGGLLGPVFSFLAFAGVLLTVWLQAKQLETSRVQSNHQEVQRVLANLSSHIDALLAQSPSVNTNELKMLYSCMTVYDVIAAGGDAVLRMPDADYLLQARHEKILASVKNVLNLTAGAIGIELQQLVWCLQEYEQGNGSDTVISFYVRRYEVIVCWLDAIDCLKSKCTEDFFKPKEYRKFLKPEYIATI
jgi:hypothetical protein